MQRWGWNPEPSPVCCMTEHVCISRVQNGGYFKSLPSFLPRQRRATPDTDTMLFKYRRLQNHGPGRPLARSYPILLEPQKVNQEEHTTDSTQQTQAGNIPEANKCPSTVKPGKCHLGKGQTAAVWGVLFRGLLSSEFPMIPGFTAEKNFITNQHKQSQSL